MKKLFRVEKTVAKYVRPVAKKISDIPLPGEDYFDAIEHLFERLRGVDRILVDPQVTSVRLVTNPEKIVLKETQRAFMYFCLYKMNIDGIIVNRILPDDVKDTYFQAWRKSQRRYLDQTEACFGPIPAFHVALFKDEILGYDRLKVFADRIYGQRNPLDRFFTRAPYRLVKENGEYRLAMKLPFIEKRDVRLSKISDELIVRVGRLKRHILLPRHVAASKEVKARLEGQHLFIHFRGEDHGKREA